MPIVRPSEFILNILANAHTRDTLGNRLSVRQLDLKLDIQGRS